MEALPTELPHPPQSLKMMGEVSSSFSQQQPIHTEDFLSLSLSVSAGLSGGTCGSTGWGGEGGGMEVIGIYIVCVCELGGGAVEGESCHEMHSNSLGQLGLGTACSTKQLQLRSCPWYEVP